MPMTSTIPTAVDQLLTSWPSGAARQRKARSPSCWPSSPPRARQALASLSPLAVVPRLRGLLIAHGTADDSIPFTESLRRAEAAGDSARLAILHTSHHTGPEPF
jgi:dipeptidyl aminopeptidase/acylaminoacyl peptidase